MIKVHIVFDFKDTPWGGGNQFLKALRKFLIGNDAYTDKISQANVILFNSHQHIDRVFRAKLKYPHKIFIHRIDGPMRLYNENDDKRDLIVNYFNALLADGTVFQSKWSRQENYRLGIKKTKFKTTILNAPDPEIFNKKGKNKFDKNRKIRLIATSWSNNLRKGFDVYKWIDKNLDFNKYEVTFVGNSPAKFNNIKMIQPLTSQELAEQLKKHDIFITASRKDPCSNSLIEALHCGLPSIVYNDGGHPEIIKNAGKIFNQKEEIINILKNITQNYEKYQDQIKLPLIDKIAEQYYDFMKNIHKEKTNNKYMPKKLTRTKILYIKLQLHKYNLNRKFNKMMPSVWG